MKYKIALCFFAATASYAFADAAAGDKFNQKMYFNAAKDVIPVASFAGLPDVPPVTPPQAVSASSAAAGENGNGGRLNLKGFISGWTQYCPGGVCNLPAPEEKNVGTELSINLPDKPGEAGTAGFEKQFAFKNRGAVSLRLTLYAVCPGKRFLISETGGQNNSGKGRCPGMYYQAQIELSGDAQAFCAVSLNESDAIPFPVMMCSGPDAKNPSYRLGITTHRLPL